MRVEPSARAIRTAAAVGLAMVLAACAGGPRVAEQAGTGATVINAPRSARGNPPFYEVLGKRYYVLKSSDGYRERGIASWYGPDFHGLSTSGGEPYDMYALTAAHKTLPIPTWVEVTNLANHKHVIVKINDRGPFVANRIIDLSYEAAKELDMIGSGTAMVEVRALGVSGAAPLGVPTTLEAANRTPSPEAPSATPPARHRSFSLISSAEAATLGPGDRLFVQVGAFSERGNAERLLNRLESDGYKNAFIWTDDRGTRTLHRVRIGPLAREADFDALRKKLRAAGIYETQLIVGQ